MNSLTWWCTLWHEDVLPDIRLSFLALKIWPDDVLSNMRMNLRWPEDELYDLRMNSLTWGWTLWTEEDLAWGFTLWPEDTPLTWGYPSDLRIPLWPEYIPLACWCSLWPCRGNTFWPKDELSNLRLHFLTWDDLSNQSMYSLTWVCLKWTWPRGIYSSAPSDVFIKSQVRETIKE